MYSVEQLVANTEAALAFLGESGLRLQSREVLAVESFKGGFLLTFAGRGSVFTVEYLDMQFEVRLGSRELFGPTVHPEFSGNMFSREHLIEHLPHLAQVVRDEYAKVRKSAA